MEAFNLRKQAFILSLESHYPTLTFPSEMIQLDRVSDFQTFIESRSLLLTGISYENAMYETVLGDMGLEPGSWPLGHFSFPPLGPLVTSLDFVVVPVLAVEVCVKSAKVVSQLPWDGTPKCPISLLLSYCHFFGGQENQ